jgi:hypothetical protein
VVGIATIAGVATIRRCAPLDLRAEGVMNSRPAAMCTDKAFGMFVVTEADAAAIRATFDQEGELSAAIELRRRFPGITDNAKARACARIIAGWMPPPAPPSPVTWLRPRKDA